MSTNKTTFNNLTITTSDRNLKLVPNDKVKFIIWNLPAGSTCPYASNDCIKFCYAKKAERIYKTVKECRVNNYLASRDPDFILNMLKHIDGVMNKRTYKNAKAVVFRVHESGDFYSQGYFDKWLTIATIAGMAYKNLIFIAYTKSLRFIHDAPANFVIRSSLDNSTTDENKQLTAVLDLPTYKAVNTFSNTPGVKKCRCEDCGTCLQCMTNKAKNIECEIH